MEVHQEFPVEKIIWENNSLKHLAGDSLTMSTLLKRKAWRTVLRHERLEAREVLNSRDG